jgi:hypothetical protein
MYKLPKMPKIIVSLRSVFFNEQALVRYGKT